jgi:hypothetical protein
VFSRVKGFLIACLILGSNFLIAFLMLGSNFLFLITFLITLCDQFSMDRLISW